VKNFDFEFYMILRYTFDMQKKRLFVAMPIPRNAALSIKRITEELEEKFKDFSERQIRFTHHKNWHITVAFLGEQDDNALPAVADAVRIASRKFAPPEIAFEKISYFPAHGGKAKMIWLNADRASSERVAKIKDILENELALRGVAFQKEMKSFSGHVTVARLAKEIESASLPRIERPLRFSFSAVSLDLAESELMQSGVNYDVLQSFGFEE